MTDTTTTVGLQDVVDRLAREREARVDLVVSTDRHARMELGSLDREPRLFITAPELNFNGHFDLTPHAHRQIVAHAGIPAAYYDRMREDHPELLVQNVEAWWNREPANRLARLLIPRDDDQRQALGRERCRGWLSESYKVVDSYDYLLAALDAAREFNAHPFRAHIDDERMYLMLLTDNSVALDGARLQQGVLFQNSEVGDGAYRVMPFALNHECKNVVARAMAMRGIHLGSAKDGGVLTRETIELEARAILAKIGDWTRFALNPDNLDQVAALFRGASGVRLEQPARLVVANVVRSGTLNKREADAILERYLRQDDDSQAGLVNAVTYAAHATPGLSFARQVEMEELGGRLLELSQERFLALAEAPVSGRTVERAFSQN